MNSYTYYGVLLMLFANYKQCQGGLLSHMERTRCVNTTFHLDNSPLNHVFHMLHFIQDEEEKEGNYEDVRQFCKLALWQFRPEIIVHNGMFDYYDVEPKIYFKADRDEETFCMDPNSHCQFENVAIWYKGQKYIMPVTSPAKKPNLVYRCYLTWPTKDVLPRQFIGIGRELFILNKSFYVGTIRTGYFILKFEGSEHTDGTYSLADIAFFNPQTRRIEYFPHPNYMHRPEDHIFLPNEDRLKMMRKFQQVVRQTRKLREEQQEEEQEEAAKEEKEENEKLRMELRQIREEERELKRQELLQKEKEKAEKLRSEEERIGKLQKESESRMQKNFEQG